jgi:hypothetical protein
VRTIYRKDCILNGRVYGTGTDASVLNIGSTCTHYIVPWYWLSLLTGILAGSDLEGVYFTLTVNVLIFGFRLVLFPCYCSHWLTCGSGSFRDVLYLPLLYCYHSNLLILGSSNITGLSSFRIIVLTGILATSGLLFPFVHGTHGSR